MSMKKMGLWKKLAIIFPPHTTLGLLCAWSQACFMAFSTLVCLRPRLFSCRSCIEDQGDTGLGLLMLTLICVSHKWAIVNNGSFSSPEPTILLACGWDRELWPDPIFWACAEYSFRIFNQSDWLDLTGSPRFADFRFWTKPELSIPTTGQKDRRLWGREWGALVTRVNPDAIWCVSIGEFDLNTALFFSFANNILVQIYTVQYISTVKQHVPTKLVIRIFCVSAYKERVIL